MPGSWGPCDPKARCAQREPKQSFRPWERANPRVVSSEMRLGGAARANIAGG